MKASTRRREEDWMYEGVLRDGKNVVWACGHVHMRMRGGRQSALYCSEIELQDRIDAIEPEGDHCFVRVIRINGTRGWCKNPPTGWCWYKDQLQGFCVKHEDAVLTMLSVDQLVGLLW